MIGKQRLFFPYPVDGHFRITGDCGPPLKDSGPHDCSLCDPVEGWRSSSWSEGGRTGIMRALTCGVRRTCANHESRDKSSRGRTCGSPTLYSFVRYLQLSIHTHLSNHPLHASFRPTVHPHIHPSLPFIHASILPPIHPFKNLSLPSLPPPACMADRKAGTVWIIKKYHCSVELWCRGITCSGIRRPSRLP